MERTWNMKWTLGLYSGLHVLLSHMDQENTGVFSRLIWA